jgi:hypothetical protein
MIGATLNRQKLREAVHFVTRKYALTPEKLGAVKLQKIIWYFEIKSAQNKGQPAIGVSFIKGWYGPYSTETESAISELVSAGRLGADTHKYFDNDKARFVGKGETDLSLLDEKEQRWLKEISEDVCENHTAESISEKTHDAVWKAAGHMQRIPLLAALVRLRVPTDEAMKAITEELEAAK